MKILFIEDTTTDVEAFNNTLDLYRMHNPGVVIDSKNIASLGEFKGEEKDLDNYDAVIVDIKLKDTDGTPDADTDAGNQIIERIENSFRNIPIYICTGTPENVSYRGKFVIGDPYIKGEQDVYKNIIDHAYKLHNTGLMQLIGGKGKLQELVQKIYKENIKSEIEKCIEHKNSGKDTEGILSRYIAACISAHLESSCPTVKEEMFMCPPVNQNLKTGSVIKNNETNEYFVVLTPECDLVIRAGGRPKTDRVLICKLEGVTADNVNLQNIIGHKLPSAYCLPKNTLMPNLTCLNFRNIVSIEYDEAMNNYTKVMQILPDFTKEIIQKFSSYYSRQGQPDFADGELCREHCLIRPE